MNIALLHYHLRPGGVREVMLNQARALRSAGDKVCIVCGEGDSPLEDIETLPVPELHYDRCRSASGGASRSGDPGAPGKDGALLTEAIMRALDKASFAPDLLHFHNPLIKKNSALLEALRILGASCPLLLQNHDLAEDFRPDVYSFCDYPENCHYAVINSRDYGFMNEAGLAPEGLHLLPNEVRSLSLPAQNSGYSGKKRRYLYPVRGIRRKNLGELLLLSLFIERGCSAAVTQRPTTDRDAVYYERWKKTAAALNLPLEFELGEKMPFVEALESARCVVTTSVKEGFGFSFLEPWTASIPVLGRRLDFVCRDFEKNGVRFDALYSGIAIPPALAPPALFRNSLEKALGGVYRAYGLEVPEQARAAIKAAYDNSAAIDFGILDEEMQEDIIVKASGDASLRKIIADLNPHIEEFFGGPPPVSTQVIEQNRQAVKDAYSAERISSLLREIHRKALVPVKQRLSRQKLLDLYLDPARISLTGIACE